MSDAVLY